MYFTIFCLITISATIQGGPLPKILSHRLPKWVKLEPIKIFQDTKEALRLPLSRKNSLMVLDIPLDTNAKKRSEFFEKRLIKNELRSLLGKNEEQMNDGSTELRSIFGNNDFIYLTKGKKTQHNNLLNIVEQLVQEDARDPYGRGVMEVSSGLRRGLRRQGGLPPKLVYEFNELVE